MAPMTKWAIYGFRATGIIGEEMSVVHRSVENHPGGCEKLNRKHLQWVMVGSRLMSVGSGG